MRPPGEPCDELRSLGPPSGLPGIGGRSPSGLFLELIIDAIESYLLLCLGASRCHQPPHRPKSRIRVDGANGEALTNRVVTLNDTQFHHGKMFHRRFSPWPSRRPRTRATSELTNEPHFTDALFRQRMGSHGCSASRARSNVNKNHLLCHFVLVATRCHRRQADKRWLWDYTRSRYLFATC